MKLSAKAFVILLFAQVLGLWAFSQDTTQHIVPGRENSKSQQQNP
jgi:hypothetical protein